MRKFTPLEIEPKWQKIWDETRLYEADLNSDKPKYIAMSMFNYPSGAGIHIGHVLNYTISEVMARFKRQQGFESYHPVGWDSFGLPAENYAIKTGVSPQESMAKIIPSYHKQYKSMGWSNDWSKEISTHLPIYYKWTQWIFSQMYKNGLAYQDSRMQWWCTKCQTVLANEQVINDKCWRHDGEGDPIVQKKEVKQWFFKVTDYADELLEAIDDLDWSDVTKIAQKNWIGKNKGAEIVFDIEDSEYSITVFTTRPDTIYGSTFLVLAPEHDLVNKITSPNKLEEVSEYVQTASKKTEVDRQANKHKTGVFTGAFATNPANRKKIPIWVADYVLVGYGTGAIMAVPAHDTRDKDFADKYDLPIEQVIKIEGGDIASDGQMVNSGEYSGMSSKAFREKIVKDLEKEGVAKEKTTYKIRDWSVSRQRYWGAPIPMINCPKDGHVLVPDEDLPVLLPELDDYAPNGDGHSALARDKDWVKVKCPKCGGEAERETDTIDSYVCSSWYFLRYFDPKNENKIFDTGIVNKWMPIDFYNGGDHATAHMIYARFITRFFYKLGLVNNPEPFKKFLFNGKIMASDGQMFSKSKGNGVDPLDIINQGYGADALRVYLMFAAPLDLWVKWDPKGVPGAYRFLNRVWNLTQEYLEAKEQNHKPSEIDDLHVLKIIHPVIKKVTEDLERQSYNTAIAAMMKATNDLYLLKAKDNFGNGPSWGLALESIIALVAPFAPHMAEELWSQLGYKESVHKDSWPSWDDRYLVADTLKVAVQINGKSRAVIEVDKDASKDEVILAARQNPKIASRLEGLDVMKVIYVPDKIVNLVVK